MDYAMTISTIKLDKKNKSHSCEVVLLNLIEVLLPAFPRRNKFFHFSHYTSNCCFILR